MPLKKNVLYGVAGAVGCGAIAWRTLFPWIGEDLHLLAQSSSAKAKAEKFIMEGNWLIEIFEKFAAETPGKPLVIFEDKIYTYDFVNQQANRVANIALNWKLNIADTVAMMVYNSPEFIWTFLGLQKLGLAVSFINYNLHGKSLLHCLQISEAKVFIVGEGTELLHAVDGIKDDLDDLPIYVQGSLQSQLLPSYQSWDDLMCASLPVPVCRDVRHAITPATPVCYIFTSGTTGLPKSVIIPQQKVLSIASFVELLGFGQTDIIYSSTPMYHSSGVGLGLFSTLYVGATMVLSRKFSARHYWEDIRRHKATVIQYIGELFRYVLSTPEHPLDKKHCVRFAFGNGLRKDIWKSFQDRFQIPEIKEFFASTEGTTATINISNKVGSCGRLSPLLTLASPLKSYLVKFDPETAQPLRDKDEWCMKIKPEQSGLLITALPPLYKNGVYKGNKALNEKKLVRDVFTKGDIYLNFGDILYLDKNYYLYFQDRLGDTFRWKGENVSTLEVANVLTSVDVVDDANVYGVHISGTEGRAGMAAIHLKDGHKPSPVNVKAIYDVCESDLPKYARPLFLRFPAEPDLTSTFKLKKNELVKDGFDPNKTSDPIFYCNEKEKTYSPVTQTSYPQLMEMRSKL
ncbi:hypothetical protein ScPMuIL_017938 [Solemya velum]